MSDVRNRHARRGVQLFGAAMAAGLLLLALVLPALAAVGPTKLEKPTVSPRSGTTATLVTFSISYRSVLDLPPEYVAVIVGSTTYPMSASGSTWKSGVLYTVQTTLPAGSMSVTFEAKDSEKFIDQTDGGTVAIAAVVPTPTPTPAPTATPAPTPNPTPTPTSNPTPTPTPTSNPTPSPTPKPTPAPTPTPAPPSVSGTSVGGNSPGGSGTTSGTVSSSGSGTATASGGVSGSAGPGVPHGASAAIVGGEPDGTRFAPGTRSGPPGSRESSSADLDGPSGATARGATASGVGTVGLTGSENGQSEDGWDRFVPWVGGTRYDGIAALGLQGPGGLPTLPTMLASSAAVATWMAFMLFKKRQRDEEELAPGPALNARAAIGSRTIANSGLAGPEDPEANMPRWRRPSLMAARRIDPTRSSMPDRPSMTFAPGSSRTGAPVGPDAGVERLTVRYAVATLLDQPDEIMGLKLGELVAGDEVQVEDRMGAYVQVLRPDGRRGWVHRTTLGNGPATATGPTSTKDEFAPPVDAENALAALLAARSLQRHPG